MRLIRLKLIRGRSYASPIVSASIDSPFVNVSEADAAYLVSTGYFIEVPADAPEAKPARRSGALTVYDSWTKPRLIKEARQLGLNINERGSKAAILNQLAKYLGTDYDPDDEVDLFTDGLKPADKSAGV